MLIIEFSIFCIFLCCRQTTTRALKNPYAVLSCRSLNFFLVHNNASSSSASFIRILFLITTFHFLRSSVVKLMIFYDVHISSAAIIIRFPFKINYFDLAKCNGVSKKKILHVNKMVMNSQPIKVIDRPIYLFQTKTTFN